jgi:hypothetical protein
LARLAIEKWKGRVALNRRFVGPEMTARAIGMAARNSAKLAKLATTAQSPRFAAQDAWQGSI